MYSLAMKQKTKLCPKCKRQLVLGRLNLSGQRVWAHQFVTYEAINLHPCHYEEIEIRYSLDSK